MSLCALPIFCRVRIHYERIVLTAQSTHIRNLKASPILEGGANQGVLQVVGQPWKGQRKRDDVRSERRREGVCEAGEGEGCVRCGDERE